MLPLSKSKITLVVLVALVAWLGMAALNVGSQRERLQAALREVEEKIRNTERGNEFLAKFSGYLESGSYLEKQARLRLNYKAPDEEVFFVYRSGADAPSELRGPSEASQGAPFWLRWWRYAVGVLKSGD